MTRKQLIQRFILNEICDDYENLEMISKWVRKNSERAGLNVQPAEIVQGLSELIDVGLAKSYRFSEGARNPTEVLGAPPLNEIESYYFWATPKGRELQLSDSAWYPFDDEDRLRDGWIAPAQ